MITKRLLSLVVVSLVLGSLTSIAAQNTSDWETLRPQNEDFTIRIPKGSTFEAVPQLYHKMELNTRLYLSQDPAGPVFAVVSVSGIKSNPAMYSEMQRMNSYVDAFKQFLPQKIRPKVPTTKLTLVGDKTLFGHQGREYSMTVGDLSGTVHAFATRKRFYAVAYLNTKKDDALRDEFLSSFVIPEKLPDPPPAVAAKTPAAPAASAEGQKQTDQAEGAAKTDPNAASGAEQAPNQEQKTEEAAANDQPKKRRPISGGILNGKAISLPKPEYPFEAREKKAGGSVVVQVTVDEMGLVTEAKAVSGHPLLVQPSVNAAMQARFSPTSLMGEPVKVTGVIVYNFSPKEPAP